MYWWPFTGLQFGRYWLSETCWMSGFQSSATLGLPMRAWIWDHTPLLRFIELNYRSCLFDRAVYALSAGRKHLFWPLTVTLLRLRVEIWFACPMQKSKLPFAQGWEEIMYMEIATETQGWISERLFAPTIVWLVWFHVDQSKADDIHHLVGLGSRPDPAAMDGWSPSACIGLDFDRLSS
jgi:hypothetical protein